MGGEVLAARDIYVSQDDLARDEAANVEQMGCGATAEIQEEGVMIDLFSYSGGDDFECEYCAGVGYTDYPTCSKPCPVPGHRERHEANMKRVEAAFDLRLRHYQVSDGNCPYCLAQGKPVGIECEHWAGMGWSKMPSTKWQGIHDRLSR